MIKEAFIFINFTPNFLLDSGTRKWHSQANREQRAPERDKFPKKQ